MTKAYYEYLGDAYNDPKRARASTGMADLDEAADMMYFADTRDLPEIVNPVANQTFDTSSPLDWMGDMAMAPIAILGKESLKGGAKRMGKSAKNVDKTMKELAEPPKQIEFHRTRQEYAPAIQEQGLKAHSPNQGQNTGDQHLFPDVNWMALNADEIPVLNSKVGGRWVRQDPQVATFKAEWPVEDYKKLKRFRLESDRHGRKAVPVAEGESSVSLDGNNSIGRMSIDLIGEDIPPENLTLLPKIPEQELKEANRFADWLESGEGVSNASASVLEKKLPKQLSSDIDKALYAVQTGEESKFLPEIRRAMKEWPKYRSGRDIPEHVDWNKFDEQIKDLDRSPKEAIYESYIPASTEKAPWNDGIRIGEDSFAEGYISRGRDDITKMNSNEIHAHQGRPDIIKWDIMRDPKSAFNKYQTAVQYYNPMKEAVRDMQNKYGDQYVLENIRTEPFMEELRAAELPHVRRALEAYGASPGVIDLFMKLKGVE